MRAAFIIFNIVLVAFTRGNPLIPLSDDLMWVMMPDGQGNPTLAILNGKPTTERAVDPPNDIQFHLYTRSNPTTFERLWADDVASIEASSFDVTKPTKMIFHGFSSSATSDTVQSIKDAYLSVGDYNVIGVDWEGLATGPLYNVAKNHASTVGDYAGHFLNFLVASIGLSLDQVHLSGHSLGAHVAGIAASTAVGVVARVTGLEAALPLYANEIAILRLDASDAAYVDLIHTDGGDLGFLEPLGHADFYPNGGVAIQPGCGIIDLTGSCSHSKSHELFVQTILNPSNFQAYLCDSVANAEIGNCGSFSSGLMGEGSDPSMRGIFYLKTK